MTPWGTWIAVVVAMALATQITRFLPFVLPARWLDNPVVDKWRVGLPAVILLLLVAYCLKDTGWTHRPWGLPEGIALAAVIGLHLWKRNALVSIGLGTALYMVLVQTGFPWSP